MGKVEVKCPYCGENVPVEFNYKDSGVLKATYCSYSYTFGARGCGKPFAYKINVKLEAQVGRIYDISSSGGNEQPVLEESEE
jgi:hypothetical protein